LVVLLPDQVSQHALPATGEVVIGRDPEADVCVPNRSVSRRHAVLRMGPVVTLSDLGSANGTRVLAAGGKPGTPASTTQGLDARRVLAPGETVPVALGDVVEVGAAMLMLQPARGATASAGSTAPSPIVVTNATMQSLHRMCELVAAGDISVLLLGETGVGKEVFAQRIHALSRRAPHPFIAVNCAELSATLLESEIFGHEKGAFTGAVGAKAGLFEAAEGGTVFLDEVGELPSALQAKLLRVIETREVRRLGGVKPRVIDVRYISATNRDLRAEVSAHRFRSDLYFRLNGFSMVIPPLRQRSEELIELAEHFAAQASGARTPPRLAPDAIAAMRGYAWPGNLRELRNAVERAVLLAGATGLIRAVHLPAELVAPPTPFADPAALISPGDEPTMKEQLREVERNRMAAALAECGGVQVRAADLIGMPLRTFKHKVKVYGLSPRAKAPRRG
jgi:transcriptional regulator with GAF, ATPase, and Fis domain